MKRSRMFLFLASAASCGESNSPPRPVGTIADRQVHVNENAVVDKVDGYFDDPDGDVLEYEAASSAADVVSADLAGTTLTLAASAKGEAKITVTAKDPDGGSAGQEFTVTVPNRAPVAVGTIAPQSMAVGESKTLNLAGYFDDEDGDELDYGAESEGVAVRVAVDGSVLTMEGLSVGMATVTAFAADPDGEEASRSVRVSVIRRDDHVFRDDFDDGLESWDTTYLDGATAEIVDENLHLVIDDCAQLPAIVHDLGERMEGNLRFSAPLWEIESGDENIVAGMMMAQSEDEGYVLTLDFQEWAYWAFYYMDAEAVLIDIASGSDEEGELVDWHGKTEIEFGLRGTMFYAVGTDTIFTQDMAGEFPGESDPERAARYVVFGLESACDDGEHGLGIDWVEFKVGG